jgi:hypothetical protein
MRQKPLFDDYFAKIGMMASSGGHCGNYRLSDGAGHLVD